MSHPVARGADWACAAGDAKYVPKIIMSSCAGGGGLAWTGRIGAGWWTLPGPVIPNCLPGWLRGCASAHLASSCCPEIHLADTRCFWAGDAADQVQDQERLTAGAAAAERRLLAEETRGQHADGNWQ